uniref:Uncharacterized protein n=1 Tax=Candidatus Kentrum sp. DK TaxID=2126562 RepID=A0A450T0D1_9GAMM|nr:MAG: hypothetical protein BECKDK2373B_GA0170837_10864 [Candidatus Kentron sp. DK]
MTDLAKIAVGILATGLIILFFTGINEGNKDTNGEIEALNKLGIQIEHLNERISELAEATNQSNLLKTKIDDLDRKITVVQNDQTESRKDLSSILARISSLDREMQQLNKKIPPLR